MVENYKFEKNLKNFYIVLDIGAKYHLIIFQIFDFLDFLILEYLTSKLWWKQLISFKQKIQKIYELY